MLSEAEAKRKMISAIERAETITNLVTKAGDLVLRITEPHDPRREKVRKLLEKLKAKADEHVQEAHFYKSLL